MKKLFDNKTTLFVSLTLACSITACSSNEESGSGTTGDGAGESTGEEGFYNPDNNYYNPDDGSEQTTFLDRPTLSEPDKCASRSYTGENVVEIKREWIKKPLSIYIMLDISSSMLQGNKWPDASSSLSAFVEDPASADLSIAIQTFPLASDMMAMMTAIMSNPFDPTTWFANCVDCLGYEVPAVPLAKLPANAPQVRDWLSGQMPSGTGTPIECALRGLTTFCSQFLQQTTNENCVGVLITDGLPTGCSFDQNLLASIARDAGIKVYAVGMDGADFNLLEMIGQQAGTDCTPADPATNSCNVTQGMTLQQALDIIRQAELQETEVVVETALDCEWVLPEVPVGQVFDKRKVNVEFTEVGKETFLIEKMPNGAGDCSIYHQGWFYSDEENPIPGQSSIKVCEDTCTMIKQVEKAQVDIVLGCESVVPG